ncbi:MAG: hypothetical protein LBH44_09900 [Treponema sp.]|jgi:hypothetical protein|nr:hypothetical protein [Treponema sp.]
MKFSKESFFSLEAQIKEAGFGKDLEIMKSRLFEKEELSAEEFAKRVIYVVLAGGFKQQTAKKIYHEMMLFLQSSSSEIEKGNLYHELLKIFGNKKKINAIVDIWQNQEKYCHGYKSLRNAPVEAKLSFLSQLPHIGKITKNHLARNLGEDVPKYDIWVQRLGVAFSGRKDLECKIDNSRLNAEIVKVCDDMFEHIKQETGLPIGYIDLVLWRACEQHILKEFK